MAVAQSAIVAGKVQRVTVRQVTSSKTGEAFTFRNALIIGTDCLADVRFPDGVTVPKEGQDVTIRVGITTYRNEAELTAEAYLA
jgi:hypothetical protein